MPVSGNSISVKSWQSFQINDGLLQKVVETVKKGESQAKSSGQVKSFEIFYHGFRQNISIGRLFLVPASVCGSAKDFPVALLYGTVVRLLNLGEEAADLIDLRTGSEFDETTDVEAHLKALKEQAFTVEGKQVSLVVFAPAWSGIREYVCFQYTDDEAKLTDLLRHLVFACYFNPAVSSGFDALMTTVDTWKFDVTDITPKLTYPATTESPFRAYPELMKAAAGKGMIFLTAKTADAIAKEQVEPSEMNVFESLGEALGKALKHDTKAPVEAASPEYKKPDARAGVPRADDGTGPKTAGDKPAYCDTCGEYRAAREDGSCPSCGQPMGGKKETKQREKVEKKKDKAREKAEKKADFEPHAMPGTPMTDEEMQGQQDYVSDVGEEISPLDNMLNYPDPESPESTEEHQALVHAPKGESFVVKQDNQIVHGPCTMEECLDHIMEAQGEGIGLNRGGWEIEEAGPPLDAKGTTAFDVPLVNGQPQTGTHNSSKRADTADHNCTSCPHKESRHLASNGKCMDCGCKKYTSKFSEATNRSYTYNASKRADTADNPANQTKDGEGAMDPKTNKDKPVTAAISKVAYVTHCKGHKDSKGELAEWCVKSHETGKILSSHTSEEAAKKHLQDMHAHSGSAKAAEGINRRTREWTVIDPECPEAKSVQLNARNKHVNTCARCQAYNRQMSMEQPPAQPPAAPVAPRPAQQPQANATMLAALRDQLERAKAANDPEAVAEIQRRVSEYRRAAGGKRAYGVHPEGCTCGFCEHKGDIADKSEGQEKEEKKEASAKQADTADNPANERGGEGTIHPKTDAEKPKTAAISANDLSFRYGINGYMITYKGKDIGGAGVKTPRERPITGRQPQKVIDGFKQDAQNTIRGILGGRIDPHMAKAMAEIDAGTGSPKTAGLSHGEYYAPEVHEVVGEWLGLGRKQALRKTSDIQMTCPWCKAAGRTPGVAHKQSHEEPFRCPQCGWSSGSKAASEEQPMRKAAAAKTADFHDVTKAEDALRALEGFFGGYGTDPKEDIRHAFDALEGSTDPRLEDIRTDLESAFNLDDFSEAADIVGRVQLELDTFVETGGHGSLPQDEVAEDIAAPLPGTMGVAASGRSRQEAVKKEAWLRKSRQSSVQEFGDIFAEAMVRFKKAAPVQPEIAQAKAEAEAPPAKVPETTDPSALERQKGTEDAGGVPRLATHGDINISISLDGGTSKVKSKLPLGDGPKGKDGKKDEKKKDEKKDAKKDVKDGKRKDKKADLRKVGCGCSHCKTPHAECSGFRHEAGPCACEAAAKTAEGIQQDLSGAKERLDHGAKGCLSNNPESVQTKDPAELAKQAVKGKTAGSWVTADKDPEAAGTFAVFVRHFGGENPPPPQKVQGGFRTYEEAHKAAMSYGAKHDLHCSLASKQAAPYASGMGRKCPKCGGGLIAKKNGKPNQFDCHGCGKSFVVNKPGYRDGEPLQLPKAGSYNIRKKKADQDVQPDVAEAKAAISGKSKKDLANTPDATATTDARDLEKQKSSPDHGGVPRAAARMPAVDRAAWDKLHEGLSDDEFSELIANAPGVEKYDDINDTMWGHFGGRGGGSGLGWYRIPKGEVINWLRTAGKGGQDDPLAWGAGPEWEQLVKKAQQLVGGAPSAPTGIEGQSKAELADSPEAAQTTDARELEKQACIPVGDDIDEAVSMEVGLGDLASLGANLPPVAWGEKETPQQGEGGLNSEPKKKQP